MIGYLIIQEPFSIALSTFVTILVVACPCSLGLATPLAIVVSEGVCAKKGILVKKSEILENAQKVNTVVFDKTGTLTYGTLKIAEIINYSNLQEENLMQVVGSLEAKSDHPIGKAFVEYLEEKNIEKLSVEGFEEISGYGIIGKIQEDSFIVGNRKILEKYNVTKMFLNEPVVCTNTTLSGEIKSRDKFNYQEDEKRLAQKGNSIVYVVKNKEIMALIGVNDIIRENVKEVISTFSKKKIDTIMLTGDNKQTAEKIAKDIGITKVIANVLPAEKANIIKQLKQENKYVLMCGDGINDSPALASSDIGVSIHSGTDIAMDSSSVILTRNDLNSIIELIEISKRTIRNIKQNLFWAFFYNTLMIPIAMGLLKPWGIAINPMIASLAMVLSSITVILNALRLKK